MPTMSQVLITEQTLTDLADKIRAKTGSTNTFTPSEMVDEIDNIGADFSELGIQGTPEWLNNDINTAIDYTKITSRQEAEAFLKKHQYDLLILNSNIKFSSYSNLMSGFYCLKQIVTFTIDPSQLSNRSAYYLFAHCYSLAKINEINMSSWIDNTSYMFYLCKSLKTVPLFNTSSVTNMSYMFDMIGGVTPSTIEVGLESVPLFNTSSVTNMQYMFRGCNRLKDVPLFNTSSVTNMNSMFFDCRKLTDESLDNILQMCINATNMSTKTLGNLGFDNSYMKPIFPASRIQALPHYQDFLDAGWTIGY